MAVPAAPFEIEIPFTGGLDEVSDSVTSDPPQLLRADNAIFTKKGSVSRRPAMDGKTATGLTGQRGNCIFERDGGAHVLTDNGVFSHKTIADNWQQTNPRGIRPVQLTTKPAVRTLTDNVVSPDSASVGGYVATVWMNVDLTYSGAPSSTTRCFLQIVEQATGTVVMAPTQLPATMLGVPHVVGIDGRFVITAMGASGALKVCALVPTGAIPGSASTFSGGATCEIYDVERSTTGAFYVVAKVGAKSFSIWALDNTGTTVASKTGITATCDTSIRGIGIFYSPVRNDVLVAYVDAPAGGALTACALFFGHIDTALTTWTQTINGTVAGNFSPRTGANGPSLAWAEVALGEADATGAIFIAWSCMLTVGSDGNFVNADNTTTAIAAMTAQTNHITIETNGTTVRTTVGLTRGYRLVSRVSRRLVVTGLPYVALGWVGAMNFSDRSTSPGVMLSTYLRFRTLGPWDARRETLFPAMMLCTPFSGPSFDGQGAVQTGIVFAAVGRFNRDVAYSYLLGNTQQPSLSGLRSDSGVELATVQPVERTALRSLPAAINWEANETSFNLDAAPSRKVHANGGVWLDGGFDGGFDGAQSFESSLHQPPEIGSAHLQDVIAVGDFSDWDPSGGDFRLSVAFEWEDGDGLLHRTPLSNEVTLNATNFAGGIYTYARVLINDPHALSAIEGYARNGIRIQLYVNDNLTVDDVIGSDTRASYVSGGATLRTGYVISRAAGLLVIDSYRAHPIVPLPTPGVLTSPVEPWPTVSQHYTFGDVLPAEPSHALRDLVSWQNRLVGIDAEDGFRLPYTKPFEERVTPEWNGVLSIRVRETGGEAVALAVMDEKLIVLKERGVSVVVGEGATATGLNEQLSVQDLPSDIGCSERNSVILVPDGLLFLSQRGPILLDRGLNLRRPRSLPDSFTSCKCAVLVPHLQQVVWGDVFDRTVTIPNVGSLSLRGSASLNYEQGQWSLWLPFGARDLVMIDDLLWRLDMTGQNSTVSPDATPCVAVEHQAFNSDPQGVYPLDVQTCWLKTSGVSGFQRLKRLVVRAATSGGNKGGLSLQMYADYDSTTAVATSSWTAAEAAAVITQQFGMHIPAQKCSAASFRITESRSEFGDPTLIEGLTLRGLRRPMESKNLGAGAKK